MVKKILLWVPPVLWASFIFYLSSIPNLELTADPIWNLITRKLAHMFVFGVLAVLIYLALGFKTITHAFLLTALYATSDEFHQTFVPTRQGAPTDIIIDSLGAFLSLLLWKRLLPPKLVKKLKK